MWSYIKHWGDTPPLHPASTERLWGRVVSESDISDSLLKDTWPANQPIPLLIFQLLSFLRSPQWPPSRQGIFSQLPAPLIANNLLFNSLSTHPWTWSCVARVGKKKKRKNEALTWKASISCPLPPLYILTFLFRLLSGISQLFVVINEHVFAFDSRKLHPVIKT